MIAILEDKARAQKTAAAAPAWFWAAAGLGAAWNAFGTLQFYQSITATQQSLIDMGMTEAQAQLMSSYPAWMTAAFALGTLGGLLGSILLLARHRMAAAAFVASLTGYVILYVGDITEGVFAALGMSQVIILSSVVLIAAALLWVAQHARRRSILV